MAEAAVLSKSSKAPDVGAMNWMEIFVSPLVPNNFKDFVYLQLQVNGQNPGHIRRAHFGLSPEEEIEKRRKALEEMAGAARFLWFKDEFLRILREQLQRTEEELDHLVAAMDSLRGKKEYEREYKALDEFHTKAQAYRKDLEGMIVNATAATAIVGLRGVMWSFGKATKAIYDHRDKIVFALGGLAKGVGEVAKFAGQGIGQVARMVLSFI